MSEPGPVVIGLGLHRRMTSQELAPIARFDPVQHDPDDTVFTASIDGIPGSVSRVVAEAPFSIAVGVVELHQYAGVSGGHKAVAVGCGGRDTIAELHRRERVLSPGVGIGVVEGNPFRQSIDALGQAARCRFALVWVAAAGQWLFGSPEAVVAEGLRLIEPWECVPERAPGLVLCVPPAKASSLYQASRAATYMAESPAPALVDGGTLVLRAHCTEGLGSETGFVKALKGCAPPWSSLLVGAEPRGPGAQRAVMLARLAQRYRLRVEGCENPEALRAVGIDAHRAVLEHPPTWRVVEHPFQRLPQCANPRR